MELELTKYFVKVVQNGSFSRAAELLRVPKSTVSKAVTRLENETGTKLLLRTTRSLTLTPAGNVFYESCLSPLQTLEEAQKALYGKDTVLSGSLKITAAEDLGSNLIAPATAKLSVEYPQLHFELIYTDQILDLVRDGFDLAFRIGKLRESNLKAKRVGEVILILVASAKYLSKNPKIKAPEDLSHHSCLAYRELSVQPVWNLRNKKESRQIPIKSRVTSNQMTSLKRMALADGGIALVPHYLCKEEIASGQLVHVLPGWHNPERAVSMVSPLSVNSSARLKLTAERLAEAVREGLMA